MQKKIKLALGCLILTFLLTIPMFALAQTAAPSLVPSTLSPPTPTVIPTPVARPNLTFHNVVTESFPDAPTSAIYHFEGKAGQFVNILLETEGYHNNRINLFDPVGNHLRLGGPNPTNTGEEIQGVRLPSNGLYSITVENMLGLSSYQIQLRQPTLHSIELGQASEGQLAAPYYAALYQFSTTADGWFDLSLTSGSFDVFVNLFDGEMNEIMRDDNSGGYRNAFIGLHYLKANQNYFILVRSKDDRSTGTFQLKVRQPQVTPIAYNESLQASFDQDTSGNYYRFYGTIGDVIKIQTDSGQTIDTLLNVITPADNFSPVDDDNGNGFDPELGPWVLAHTGEYGILLRPYIIGGAGQVKLTLSRQPPLSLDEGPHTIDFSSKQPMAALTFMGQAGAQMRLTYTVDPLMNNPPNIELYQADIILGISGGSLPTYMIDFTVPSDGSIIVKVISEGSEPGWGQFSLERLPT